MNKIFTILVVIAPMLLFASSWTNDSKKDRMVGGTTLFAMSPTIQAESKMDFPYSTTKSNLVIGCKNGEQFAYFWFSNSPNLNNTQTEDGYSKVQTRIKIGKNIKKIGFIQDWGGKSLSISNYSSSINNNEFVEMLKKTNSVLLELNWHGNGTTYFQYSLKGSSNAISSMQDDCGYTKILQEKLKRQVKIKKRKIEKLLKEKQKQKKVKDKIREIKKAMNKANTWIEEKKVICYLEKYTTRQDIVQIIGERISSKLVDCKVYSSTSTVCKYNGKNVLGDNKKKLERKYGNSKICSDDNQFECLSFIFNINNKLLRINGCNDKPIGAPETKEEKKQRCIEETGYWRFGDENQIICEGH